MPWKPSHLSLHSALAPGEADHRSKMAGLPQEKMELNLGLLAGTWTCVPGCLTLLKHKSMARSFPQQVCNTARKYEEKQEKNVSQPSQFRRRIHLALYLVSSYSQTPFIAFFSVPVSSLSLVLPPASHHVHTRAHHWQCPKQLWHRTLSGRLSRAEHNPSTLPHPSVRISLLPSWAHTALPSTHKCPRWQNPSTAGAKGGQLCAKPIVVYPGLPFPSSKKPFAWDQLARELPEVPPTMTPGSVCPCVPLCTRAV